MFLKLAVAALVASGSAAVVGIGGAKTEGVKPGVSQGEQGRSSGGGSTSDTSSPQQVTQTTGDSTSPTVNSGTTGPGEGGAGQS